MMVARRVERLIGAAPPIAAAHFRAEARPYHPVHDPEGYLNLGTAENRLLWDLLEPLLTAPRPLTAADARYAPLYGTFELREATAAFLSHTRGVPFDPDDLIIVSGATSALDIAATALCDPGEAIIVPAPYYGGFDTDLAGRSEARLIRAPGRHDEGYRVSAKAIIEAYDHARDRGLTPRAIALSSPTNPIGQVLGADDLREVLDTAAAPGLAVIADEIYANSVFGPEPFVGSYGLHGSRLPAERICTVWGFAKDFGLPGLKVGVLHTTDPQLRAAARELAYFAPVSTDTQVLLCRLLADEERTRLFLDEAVTRLRASYEHLAAGLDALGIEYLPAEAGFSVWADLSPWLPAATFEGEEALWRRLIDEARLSVLPGSGFAATDPGWFRICHTTDAAVVAEAVRRLGRILERPQPHGESTR
jgi:1-aminocyclopropane-1-carboxylate synthase 1/2/6